MGRSRISVQIDECFIKAIRNESKKRRERREKERFEHVQDFYHEFDRLGLVPHHECSDVNMKKKVRETLLHEG